MTRATFKYKISMAMQGYTLERLGKIYDMAHEQSKRENPDNVNYRADLFILACGYENHDYNLAANMMYGAYNSDFTEEELINAVKKRLQQRKILLA